MIQKVRNLYLNINFEKSQENSIDLSSVRYMVNNTRTKNKCGPRKKDKLAN